MHRVNPYQGLHGASKDMAVLYNIVCGGWLNLLLLCVPLAFASEFRAWGAMPTFMLVSNRVRLVGLHGVWDCTWD